MNGRVHLVLVPGFAGFDALGQLEYYAGVTPQFNAWKQGPDGRPHVVLHYFDNFPTAAVATRAARLRSYLAKRIARGEFADGDAVVLVGHSTAGLDIRRLLMDLADVPDLDIPVDSGARAPLVVKASRVLDLVRGLVFLSVPHQGTNIADWVRTYWILRRVVVANLRATVWGAQVPPVEIVEDWMTRNAAGFLGADLLLALRDSLREADAGLRNDPAGVADAHEAASELALYLRHIASDFHAIDDLSCEWSTDSADSPAHCDWQTRDHERETWEARGIAVRSYATLGRRPFAFDVSKPAPRWDLLKRSTYPEATERDTACPRTDVTYRTCYRACAGGPFGETLTPPLPLPECLNAQVRSVIDDWGVEGLATWDNDGIVNTASMLWPPNSSVLLVAADHMDIVGHYELVDALAGGARKYQAYDLLGSASQFSPQTFADVWNGVFTFAAQCADVVA